MDQILQLFNEHNKRLAMAASLALVIFISLSVAQTAVFFMDHSNTSTTGSVISAPVTSAPDETYRVSDLELFGTVKEVAATEVVDAPETKLNLELQGVFISDNAELSTAIIGERAKAGELYEIGDRLPGNATLSAVLVDHVLIKRGTRTEKLMFSDSKFRVASTNRTTSSSASGNGSSAASSRRQNLEEIRNRLRNRDGQTQAPPPRDNAGGSSSGQGSLAEYRDRMKQDPQGTLGEFGLSSVSGGAEGYRIGDDAPAMVRRAGLQPGDVILSVNGRPVGVASSDSALVDQVMASSRVRVEVQRGNRRFFMTVPVPK